jgi:hypothetical protein
MGMTIEMTGRVTGAGTHDSVVEFVDQALPGEAEVGVRRASGESALLRVRGITKSSVRLGSGDIITEIFFWRKAQLDSLSDGVWAEILPHSSEGSRDAEIRTLVDAVPAEGGVIQIYCATSGALTAACADFDLIR